VRRTLAIGLTIIAAIAAAMLPHRPAEVRAAALLPVRSEAEIQALDIAFYEHRVHDDPAGAADRGRLAGLYLQRARATGSYGDYARAESTARASIALRDGRNAGAFTALASALLAQHRFADARDVALELDSLEPGVAGHQALLGEIDLELGRYDEARPIFAALRHDADQFSIAARLARWYELTGKLDAAERLMAAARRRVASRTDLPREQRAWFDLRMGELAMKRGGLAAADSAFTRGLAVYPDDSRILGAQARLAVMRGDWRAAADAGERAIAIQLDPATLGALADAYAHLGDSTRAADYAAAMRVSALRQPGPIHRGWGLFLLDRGTEVETVLAKAQEELRTRKDVYGYDLLGWALYRSGRYSEAALALSSALSQGTQDAMLFFHAGMVQRALGHADEARRLLALALATNPHFDAAHAREARQALDALQPGRRRV
jgi:tetratricopeptide (TPR) repeat protein